MCEVLAPAFHKLGFKGKGPAIFRCRQEPYEAVVSTRKSGASTRQAVIFWVDLAAVHLPTRSEYWASNLQVLIPNFDLSTRYTVRADSSVEALAAEVLKTFSDYGWPALQAALDSPGYPPDPEIEWPRTFGSVQDQAWVLHGPDDVIELGLRAAADPAARAELIARVQHDP
jgi:hypothetical protein